MNSMYIMKFFIAVILSLLLGGCSGENKNNTKQSAEATSLSQEGSSNNPTEADPSTLVKPGDTSLGKGITAIYKAEDDDRYLFAFFYNDDDENTVVMREVFDEAMTKVSDKAYSLAIDIKDPNETEIIAKYGVASAPMPLALVIAPNGAVTGGFPKKFDEKQLLEAFVSPCTEKCLLALQERKLVFLCVQNSKTKSNTLAMQGVNDFKSDARFAQGTEIVALDPNNESEAKFLENLKIDPKTKVAITAFLAPPGNTIAKISGATDKDKLVATLMGAMSGGCGSSGASGCGPSGCP